MNFNKHVVVKFIEHYLLGILFVAFALPVLVVLWAVISAGSLALAALFTVLPEKTDRLWPHLCAWEKDDE